MNVSRVYNLVQLLESGQSAPAVTPNLPVYRPRNWWDRVRLGFSDSQMERDIETRLEKAVARQRSLEAEQQGAVVNSWYDAYDLYDSGPGHTREPLAMNFAIQRQLVHNCEPLTFIVDTLVRYAVAFCDTPDRRLGVVKRPGFEIRMSDKKEEATDDDRTNMKLLTRFLIEGGFRGPGGVVVEPPEDECPVGYQPGLAAFAAQVMRDTLTMDAVAIRRWGSADGRYPLVTFAAEDAARIRIPQRPFKGVANGVRQYGDWREENDWSNCDNKPIKYLKVDSAAYSSSVIETYTADQLAYCIRNPRTATEAGGYGYSETEKCANTACGWIRAMTYNLSRFDQDSIPRGVLLLGGMLDERQVQSFKLRWREMLKGTANKRWETPILRATGKDGGTVQWVPLDPAQREMEYQQFLFTLGTIFHCVFGVHPEETGWHSTSPFHAPLSEASPEIKLENSNNKCFEPLMRWFRNVLNREIVWKIYPDRRYCLEFVGLGQGDEMADTQARGTRLQFGLSTPAMEWAELDQDMPDHLKDDPAMHIPGTYAANVALLMQMRSLHMQEQAQQMNMQQAQEQHKMQVAAMRQQATQPQQPGMPGQQPQGPPEEQQQPGLPPEQPEQLGLSEVQKALLAPYSEPFSPVRGRRRPRTTPDGRVTIVNDIKCRGRFRL